MNWKLIRIIDTYIGIPLIYLMRYCMKNGRPAGQAAPIMGGPRKILLIKFWGIGNIFMMLPSVRALRRTYAKSEIDLLTLQSNHDAAKTLGCFNTIYTIDTQNIAYFLITTMRMLREIRRREYEVVVDFEQFAKFSAIFSFLTGSRETIGYDTAGQHRHYLYEKQIQYENNIHVTRSYAQLTRATGAIWDGWREERRLVQRRIDPVPLRKVVNKFGVDRERSVIMLHVGTSDNFKERRWPAKHYARLTNLLVQNHDVLIVITGLKTEAAIADEYFKHVQSSENVINLIGLLNFEEYYALVRLSDLVVTADTSPVHIASEAGIPVVGLYGPNTPILYGPWGDNNLVFYKGLNCSPCITNFNAKINVCKHPAGKGICMTSISAEEVYGKIQERYFHLTAANSQKRITEHETYIYS